MMLKFTSRAIIGGKLLRGPKFCSSLNKITSVNFNVAAGFATQAFREYDTFNEELRGMKAITVPEFFSQTVKRFGDQPALMHKDLDGDKWMSISYNEYHRRVEQIAKAFIKLGLEPKGSVSVLAFNCPEWFISQLAVNHAGGQIVGIYTTNSAEVCHFILESSRSNVVIVDDSEQLSKILKIKHKLPHLKAIVKILPPFDEGLSNADGFYTWKELEEMNVDEIESEYEKRLKGVVPTDCCSLCYTSGTTGTPKGAILTHDALVFEINALNAALQCYEDGKEIVVSYLPLAHMSGQLQELFMGIRTGAAVYFADRNAFKGTLINTLKDARPTNFGSVPRLYEKFYERLSQVLSETTGIKRTLLDWARRVTLEYHLQRLSGHNPSTLQYEIAKKLVLNKVKAGLGFDRSKNFFVGASPISIDVTHFFMSLDIPLQECYGMTENTGIAFARAKWHNQLQSVGKVLPGLEAKIVNADEKGVGEICTRGRSTFTGYINDDEKTKETIDSDKWLHTGDLGYFDKEGFLFVTGRIKELIITAGGENIPFLHIENLVKRECLAISNAFLIGDKRKFLSMLITLKTEVDVNNAPLDDLSADSLKLMKELKLNVTKLSEAYNNPKVIEAIQAAINRANENSIANFQKVQKFAILPSEFSMSSGEFSPTMKLKRSFVLEKYKNIIDDLYK